MNVPHAYPLHAGEKDFRLSEDEVNSFLKEAEKMNEIKRLVEYVVNLEKAYFAFKEETE